MAVITKSGSNLNIVGYANSASSSSLSTITLSNIGDITITINGNLVKINPSAPSVDTFNFEQVVNGRNRITEIQGVDVTAYTALQVKEAIDNLLSSGMNVNLGVASEYIEILNLTTSSTGANWVAFSSVVCKAVDVVNATGTDLEYRRNGAGLTMYVPDSSGRTISGITNSNQIEFRRIDVNNAQVTITAEAIRP